MLRHPVYTRDRVRQLVDKLGSRIYSDKVAVVELVVAGPTDRITYDEAQKLSEFRQAKLGDQFGPPWATFWFRGKVDVPADWKGDRVDLLWDSQSEATLWIDGRSIQGLNMNQGNRPDAVVLAEARGGETLTFQIEMACNNKFGISKGDGLLMQSDPISPFHLRRCELARFDPQAWDLYYDAVTLVQLEQNLQKDSSSSDHSWQGLLLSELNRLANTIDLDDRSTWPAAKEILKKLYENRNASRAFELTAIGHAHIDCAWLWPLAETHRKCVRSFSTATTYMRDYPEYRFACSQAYQYEYIKQHHKDLYQRIRDCVASGQWVPVGGTWVEPDCNIPSGEALCRQFLFGQRFFEREFGRRCKEFWNPDVFGYNGQLPQIMRLAGIERFLTQKLSWNRFNTPHHHTFTWRAIDGSEVLTHFPPADSYNAMGQNDGLGEVEWIRRSAREYRDHDRSHEGIMLYGFGDGGGGPTKHMLEIIRRSADLQGLPRTQQRSSDEFFERLEKDCADRPLMIGELYLEYHRGTYTSQAQTKKNNRKAQQLLHDLELVSVLAHKHAAVAYPREALERMWKIVLLNQFHDILPGSSIKQVYEDADAQYAQVFAEGQNLVDQALGTGSDMLNTIGVARHEVVETDGKLKTVTAQPFALASKASDAKPVSLVFNSDKYVIANEHIRAVFTQGGRLVSLLRQGDDREVVAGQANILEIYDDHPTNFDAWDVDPFHIETRQICPEAQSHKLVRRDPLRGEVAFSYRFGMASTMQQVVQLDAGARRLEIHCHVDWHEDNKMLKLAYPVNVIAMNATYEMQFGDVERPTHYNTPYDLARYEVPMHHWFDLSEHGLGMAILNDCKYGGSVYDNVMRLSLLRAPASPDPTCDRGEHRFSLALMPHAGNWRNAGVVAEALRFNYPLRFVDAQRLPGGSLAHVDTTNLIIDTIKKAEDSDDLVIRLYECHGARGVATLCLAEPPARAVLSNILEDEQSELQVQGSNIRIYYQPRQVITILVTPTSNS